MLPVNCKRMMTAGAWPLTIWNYHYLQTEGVKGTGTVPGLSDTYSTKTQQPKQSVGDDCVHNDATAEPTNQCFSHPRPSPPITLYVIYALCAPWTSVAPCLCVWFSSLGRMWLLSLLLLMWRSTTSLRDWLPDPLWCHVQSQCWNEKTAPVLPTPLVSVSRLRALTSFWIFFPLWTMLALLETCLLLELCFTLMRNCFSINFLCFYWFSKRLYFFCGGVEKWFVCLIVWWCRAAGLQHKDRPF